MDRFKQFLEDIQKFDTPAKAKYLRYSVAEIEEHKKRLKRLRELQGLRAKVSEWNRQANYLLQAQNVLPADHPWQDQAGVALKALLSALVEGRDG